MPTLQVEHNGIRYAWLQTLDDAHIRARAAQAAASQWLTAVGFGKTVLFGLIGLFLAYLHGFFAMLSLSFWLTPSWASVFLYAALLSVAFLFFHQSRMGADHIALPSMTQPLEPGAFEAGGAHVNLADVYAQEAMQTVERAYELAQKFGHRRVEPIHLFVGAMDAQDVSVVFGRLGLRFEDVQDAIGRRLQTRELGKPIELSPQAERALVEAFVQAATQGRSEVGALELFARVYAQDEFVRELLLDKGVNEQAFENMISWLRIHETLRERYRMFRRAAISKPTGAMNRAMTSVATPVLDAVSEDLTTSAVGGQLPLMVGREAELDELLRVIEGGRQSVVLVGSPGVGKTTMLAGLAERMVKEEVPKVLQDRRLVRVSIPHLVSGADASQAQERLLMVLSEVARSRNIVLAFTDIDQLVGNGSSPRLRTGGSDASDLAATLVDFLSRTGTFAIATATPQAYASQIERSVLGRVFQKVDILEPDQESAILMLESKMGGIEYEHQVIFSYEAVERAVTLPDRYMHETYLPHKAIEVARETALQVAKDRGKDALVTGEDVARIVSAKTGVPTASVELSLGSGAQEEAKKLLGLEERLHDRVIGQDEAVHALSAALRRARTQLGSESRPTAAFLFLGPTGVGKTQLAKTLAQTYFGSEDAMIRLDMSEYQDASSIHRLLGAPGSGAGGLLTESVRKQPFAIILLDEFEKAHQDILNVFLQVFDDGRLTDATGRTIDFTNTMIIATSNAGTTYIQDAIGRGETMEAIKTRLIEAELRGVYAPELLNRFDGIIVFAPLTPADVEAITRLFLREVAARLEPKGIGFRASDAAVSDLATRGFDPAFGARPLRRLVQDEVDDAIATALLSGDVRRRDTIVLEPAGKIHIEQAADL